jgi:transcriptional regulator with XRE-family HTH domain
MEKSTHSVEYRILRKELRAARVFAELSQRQLAERLKVPHSWIAKVESGERRVDLIEVCWFLTACSADPLNLLSMLAKRFPRGAVRGAKGDRAR